MSLNVASGALHITQRRGLVIGRRLLVHRRIAASLLGRDRPPGQARPACVGRGSTQPPARVRRAAWGDRAADFTNARPLSADHLVGQHRDGDTIFVASAVARPRCPSTRSLNEHWPHPRSVSTMGSSGTGTPATASASPSSWNLRHRCFRQVRGRRGPLDTATPTRVGRLASSSGPTDPAAVRPASNARRGGAERIAGSGTARVSPPRTSRRSDRTSQPRASSPTGSRSTTV